MANRKKECNVGWPCTNVCCKYVHNLSTNGIAWCASWASVLKMDSVPEHCAEAPAETLQPSMEKRCIEILWMRVCSANTINYRV